MKSLNCIETRLCKLCGSPFSFNAIPSKVAKGQGLFCSGICQRRGRQQRQFEDSFFSRIGKITENGCLLWGGNTDDNGYGRLGETLAHRISYELLNGPIGGLHVLHRCDNPTCINPAHLFLGTNLDNINDKISKRRQAKGEMFNRKLTESQIKAIRLRQLSGESQAALASEFGVQHSHINRIVNRRSWKHVS